MKRIFYVISLLALLSCVKDDYKSYKCTTYLKGNIWDQKTVSECEDCFASVGYTVTCQEN